MSEKVKLEAYVARPPTSKCRQLIAMLEDVVRRYPDQVRLVVFERGAAWPEEPSRTLKYAIHKASTVPMCYVGGKLVIGGKVPAREDVEREVENALRRLSPGAGIKENDSGGIHCAE